MQARKMRHGRSRTSIDRLLGLLCAVLLLTLVGGCRDEGPAEAAGREMDETVEMASETSDGTLEKFEGEMDDAVEESADATGEDADRE